MMLIFGNAFLKTLQTIHRLAARLVPYFAVSIPIQGRRSRGVPSPPPPKLEDMFNSIPIR
jgi:hypothetical protein